VLDPAGLATRACECHGVVKKEMARLLSDVRYRPASAAEPDAGFSAIRATGTG
jgi:hypothetical protein